MIRQATQRRLNFRISNPAISNFPSGPPVQGPCILTLCRADSSLFLKPDEKAFDRRF
jgi:hypothetical protein